MTAKLKRDSILSDYRIALERYTMQLQCELASDLKSLGSLQLDEIIGKMPNVYRDTDNLSAIHQRIDTIVHRVKNTRSEADITLIAALVNDDHDPDSKP